MSRTCIPTQQEPVVSQSAGTASASTIDRILRISDVITATGLGRNTIYRWMNDGQFPLPVDLGGCRVGWRLSDVRAWIESRPVVKTVRLSRNVPPWQMRKAGFVGK